MFRKFGFLFLIVTGLIYSVAANAQSTPYHYLSAASNNSTLISANVSGTIQSIHSIVAINTTATVYYIRFYDRVAAPTCSSATGVVANFPIPASTSGAGFVLSLPDGMLFGLGIGFCITGAGADNDNTNAATGVTIDVTYNTH